MHIAVGVIALLLCGTVLSVPVFYWPVYLIPLVLSLIGLIKARGWVKRVPGIIVFGLSGGLFLGDFLVFLVHVFLKL